MLIDKSGQQKLDIGGFYDVRITGSEDYDLFGRVEETAVDNDIR